MPDPRHDAFERVRRHLDPPGIPALREAIQPLVARLANARTAFAATTPPNDLQGLARQLTEIGEITAAMFDDFCAPAPHEQIARVLGAMHKHCRAQERLYPLRAVLPPVSLFFTEPARRDRVLPPDPDPLPTDPPVGVVLARIGEGRRGGFSMYVPERYTSERDWPLVVALHGGSGTGADFLWTWLTEARTRGFLLMAPTSLGSTWSLDDPELDSEALRAMLDYVRGRWRVDAAHVLLTGLSDGATFALLAGLMPDAPYTALAPVSGVMHPANLVNGNLERARNKPIYLVHGALDWMFPVAMARVAHQTLRDAGAAIVFRELADLSHTYPREENGRILEWFDPSLSLPAA